MHVSSADRITMRLTVIALLCQSFASAKTLFPTLSKREETASTEIIQPWSWPASQYWDGNDGTWSSFAIQVGSPAQVLRVLPSTAGYNIWLVLPGGCPSFYPATCPNNRGGIWYSGNSTTYNDNGSYELGVETNLGIGVSAQYGFDTATLGYPGQGGFTFNRSVIAAYNNATFFMGSFGLNPRRTNFSVITNNSATSFMENLKADKKIPSLSYGYTAGAKYQLSGVPGSLTLGGYDTTRFQPNGVSFPLNSDNSRDLLVHVINMTITTKTLPILGYSEPFYAFIDSTIPWLVLPISFCRQFEKTFNLTYNSALGVYAVNASQHNNLLRANPSITLVLGDPASASVSVELPYSAFDLNISYPIIGTGGQSSYYFPLQRGTNDTQYALGRVFLQEAYLTVDYDRGNFSVAPCDWSQDLSKQQIKAILTPDTIAAIEQADRDAKKKTTIAAAVGAVVGVVVLVIAIVAFWWFRRRRQRQHQRDIQARLEEERLNARSKPKSYDPVGNELSGETGVHEMDHYGPTKLVPELDSPDHVDMKAEMEGSEGYMADQKLADVGTQEMEGSYPVYELDGGAQRSELAATRGTSTDEPAPAVTQDETTTAAPTPAPSTTGAENEQNRK